MGAQCRHEMQGVEPFREYFVECQEGFPVVSRQKSVRQRERIFVIEDIEIFQDVLVFDFRPAERYRLVENRKGIPHCPVCLVRNDMQGFVVYLHPFLVRDCPELSYDIVDGYPVEIVCLAA